MMGGQAGYETTTYQLLPFLWSMGGDIIGDGKVIINSDANLRALTFLKNLMFSERLVAPDTVDFPSDGALRDFAQGEAVLSLGGSYENYLIRSIANWDMSEFLTRAGFVTYPTGPDGSPATLVGGMTYGVYRQSHHPKRAISLLKKMLTPEILKPFSLQIGNNTAHKTVAEAIGPDDDGFLGRTAYLLERARSRPSLPTYNQVSLQFQKMIEACLKEPGSVEDALNRAAERISAITSLPIA
jgi:ABC-type glycerol-3-phosphate transport system substrate-binding protein